MDSTTKHPTPPQAPPASRPTTQLTIGCLVIPLLLLALGGFIFFRLRAQASAQVVVPEKVVALVRTAPVETAPLLARFGEGRSLQIVGRSADWRWLAVTLWDGRQGWMLRPLDILVWQIDADLITPQPPTSVDNPTAVAVEMVTIPGDTFTMGSPPGLGEADEGPAHPVSLSPFAIDRTEVTVAQYWACVVAGACVAPSSDAGRINPHYLNDPTFDNYPVINIPWLQASHYCTWQGKRLPTEAEWEMAAGWDQGRKAKLRWPWGNDSEGIIANIGAGAEGEPAPVGSHPDDVSPAGVLDMGGNVSEWVFDWYKVDYYSVADNTDPVGPTYRRGEGTGRVVRGGSFADDIAAARTANRGHQAETYGYPTIGFRCAQDVE